MHVEYLKKQQSVMHLNMKKRTWKIYFVICVFFGQFAFIAKADNDGPVYVPGSSHSEVPILESLDSSLPTVTVRGFLNFRTTVDGTVIVFTPASEAPPEPSPASFQLSSSAAITGRSGYPHASLDKDRGNSITSELENEANTDGRGGSLKHNPSLNDLTTPDDSGDSLQKPIYGHTPIPQQYPTGLVTVLGGTHVNDGATTVYETKVIGTYIDGKYAQILQSTSQIIFPTSKNIKPEATPEPIRTQLTSATKSPLFISKPISKDLVIESAKFDPRLDKLETKEFRTSSVERQAERRGDDLLQGNVVLQTSFKLPETVSNRIARPTQSLEKTKTPTRSSYTVSRRFRPTVTTDVLDDENTVPESQNNRRSPPRFRYVLPRRNSPSVQLNRFKVKLTARNFDGASDRLVTPHENTFDSDDETLEDYDPLHAVDPAKVTYQRTTITSEVTLHVGRRKSVRTLTITTSVPKTKYVFETDAYNEGQDIFPANNNVILATSLADNEYFPPNVVTRTYTTTERMLKTSLIPILEGNTTNYHTVTESFFILKLITGYKTLPPGDVTLVTGDSTETEIITATEYPGFDSLLEGAIPFEPAPHQNILQTAVPNGLLQAAGSRREHAILPLEKNANNQVDMSNTLMSLGAALQQNPLAAVYLGLQQLNRQATLYSTITQASSYVATDTIYNTKVVSIYDGRRTRTRTLSESVSTTERTVTTYMTTVTPYLNTQLFPQNQLQQLLGTQLPGGMVPSLPPPPPQYSTVTSTYTTATIATSLNTRIYTLVYNALSTKFRTITSTTTYETIITATTTSEVPIAITAPPGGVFPFLG